MKDDEALERKLMRELDLMYRHVADLESDQAGAEDDNDPCGKISAQGASTREKVIPFPTHRIQVRPRKPLQEARQKSKPSYRFDFIVTYFLMLFFAFIAILSLVRLITIEGDRHQLTFPIHLKSSPSIQRKEDATQEVEKREQKGEPIPHETKKPDLLLP